MTNQNDLPPHLQARYGMRKSRFQSLLPWILASGVLLLVVGYFYFQRLHPGISGKLQSFTVISESEVDVRWQVTRPESQTTFCVIRAQDRARRDVGYSTVTISPGASQTSVNYPLATSDPAVLVEVLGCSDSPVMRVPPANFPPGVKIPNQPSPGVAPTP